MNILKAYAYGQKMLGMNARNLSYIKPYNTKKAISLVDNKIHFKTALEKAGIPTPKLLGKMTTRDDLNNFDFESLPKSFVLKPTAGFGGEGIMVLFGEHKVRNANQERLWVKTRETKLSETDLRNHVKNILDGTYSRTNTPDSALFEERIKINKLFRPYAYKGIPDIRVIVFNRIPIMAMLRLPTRESDGKANVHQGGIGVGIDIATGVTTHAITKNTFIDTVPQTRLPLSGIRIPYWETILDISVRTTDITGLGFAGIDIAHDRDQGPVILEANARPGLSIQLANKAPLKERLEKVASLKTHSIKRAIRVAKDLFGGEIEEEVEEITGRSVIGLRDTITLYSVHEQEKQVKMKVDTGADSSSIEQDLIWKLGLGQVFQEFEDLKIKENTLEKSPIARKKYINSLNKQLKNNPHRLLEKVQIIKSGNGISLRPYIKIRVKLENQEFQSVCSITDRSHLDYPFLLGRTDMKRFLIDPRKTS